MDELILPKITDCEQELEKIRAAYALNVCAVSVSQIVDYNDQYILEQEYENTLNNLNLERMPKDEAFLSILTETLNVVTFFRIYASKKKQIEDKYQLKIKNAIWSAVPNLAFIISSGKNEGIYALIASLATEVGLGYMNYRKTKAENNLEYQSDKLELEYTAIEQLNAIRMQLFITSWKIADKYDFPDNYRLTENQIKQFNEILMDPNANRKFNRLFSIRENFIAFPPFWYYLGNAANSIISSENSFYSEEYLNHYRDIAGVAYEYFIKLNEKVSVLRSDELVSACALEYCELLPISEIEKKSELLKIAAKWSGGRNDVLQICAFEMLKLERFSEAERLFRQLVNESYNEELNAQVLSSIYANYYFVSHEPKIELEHKLLSQQVASTVLFPLPIGNDEFKTQSELWEDYMAEQKVAISVSAKTILDNYFEKFSYRMNKKIMNFDSTSTYSDAMFLSDGGEYRSLEAKRIFKRPEIVSDYINRLQDVTFSLELVDALNEMLYGLKYLNFLKLDEAIQCLEKKIKTMSGQIEKLEECMNSRDINYKNYEEIFEKVTFDRLVRDFSDDLRKQLDKHIESFADMKDLISMEIIMNEFAEKNNVKIYERDSYRIIENQNDRFEIDPSVVGNRAISLATEKGNRRKLQEIIKSKSEHFITNSNSVRIYFPGESEFEKYFDQTNELIASKIKKENLKEQAIAIIDDRSIRSFDLVLTYNSVVPCLAHKICLNVKYEYVKYDSQRDCISIGAIQYKNVGIDMSKLAICLGDIAREKKKMDEFVNQKETFGSETSTGDTEASTIKMLKKCNKCKTYMPETATECSKCGSKSLISVPDDRNI